jgi:hypothetical protein
MKETAISAVSDAISGGVGSALPHTKLGKALGDFGSKLKQGISDFISPKAVLPSGDTVSGNMSNSGTVEMPVFELNDLQKNYKEIVQSGGSRLDNVVSDVSAGAGDVSGKTGSAIGKPDFIVTEKGTVMPTNKDFNLVDTRIPTGKEGGDWFQIHNTEGHGTLGNPHTHYPEINTNGNVGSTVRRDVPTTAQDIDKADDLLRNGTMRERINRKDKGGPIR